MRVILNSDVVRTRKLLATGLPKHIEQFCRESAAAGAILVLPRTTRLEDEQNQTELLQAEITALEGARTLLSRWAIKVPEFDAKATVPNVDLGAALKTAGATVEVCEPTLEDYRDAEWRAALHLSPRVPDAASDEMRDLVIWAVALRIAKHDGKALLVSRDEVHSHSRGQLEADAANLHRVRNFDDATEFLGTATVAGQLARTVLALVWGAVKAAGVPVPTNETSSRVGEIHFKTDAAGYASVTLALTAQTPDGQLALRMHVFQASPLSIQAELSDMSLAKVGWKLDALTVSASGQLPLIAKPAPERLASLRALIEGRQ